MQRKRSTNLYCHLISPGSRVIRYRVAFQGSGRGRRAAFALFTFALLSWANTSSLHAQWTPTNGPYGGNITCFAVSGTNLFAGTVNDGVFLSTNSGASWTQVNNGLTNLNVLSLAVSGANIFVGTNAGMFASTDNGSSWSEVTNGLVHPVAIYSLASNSTNVFAGTQYGLYVSTNSGTSWTQSNANIYAAAIAVLGTNTFVATSNGQGIYLSTDNGGSWTQVNNGLTNLSIKALVVSGTNIFAGSGGGIFLSTDNGSSWNNVSSSINAVSFTVSGTNIFAGASGVFLSTDNGTSWTAAGTGLPNTSVTALGLLGTDIFAGTGYGVFVSANNGSGWTSVNTGISNTNVFALASAGADVFAGTDVSGAFLSSNNGTSWNQVNNGLSNLYVRALAVSPDGQGGSNIFAGSNINSGGVFLTTDSGATWSAVNAGLTNTFVGALASLGANVFAGTGGGVFLTTNNGASWTSVNTGLTNTNVTALAVSGTNIFVGTSGGVFVSADTGATWTPVDSGLTNTNIMCLAASGPNLYAGTYGGGVFLSTDSGATWTAVNTGLTTSYVYSLAALGTNIFAGTDVGGVFLSTNNGGSWTATGLPNFAIETFSVSDTNLFAGTYGAGVWRSGWNFTPGAPAKSSPADGAADSSLSLTLWWNPSNGATSYGLQISTDPNFGSFIVNQSNVSGTSFSVSGLSYNTKYYWRVDATNSAGTSGWSSVWSFTPVISAPAPPTLANPTNGSSGVSTGSTFSWNASTSATSYRVQVSTDSTFATTFRDTSGIASASDTVTGLANLTKYYWRVNATNAGGTSPWSSVWSFTTGKAISSGKNVTIAEARVDSNHDLIPDHKVAGDTLTIAGVITSPNFESNPQSGYFIQDTTAGIEIFSFESTPSNVAVGDSVLVTGTVDQFRGLTQFVPLAMDTADFKMLKHNTVLPPAKVLSVSTFISNAEEYEGSLVEIDMLHYSSGWWPTQGSNGTLYYKDSTDRDSVQVFVDKDTQVDGTPMPADLVDFTGILSQYSSAATVYNDGYELVPRDTSDIRRVLVTPSTPTLISPANGSTNISTNVTLTWNAATGATSYWLQVSTDSTFATTYYDTSGITDTSKTIRNLLNSTKYYWRVNATDSSETSVWSDVWGFTTVAGNSWMLAGLAGRAIQSIATNSMGYVFAGSDSGLYISTDSGNVWMPAGLQRRRVISITIGSTGYIFAGTDSGVYLSTDNGKSWTQSGLASTVVTSLLIGSNRDVYAGTYGAGVYRSTDNGNDWVQLSSLLYISSYVQSLANAPCGYILGGMETAGIVVSTDSGNTWEKVRSGIASPTIGCLAVSPTGSLFAGTENGSGGIWGGVYRSTDNGKSWVEEPSTYAWSWNALAISGAGYVFAGSYNGAGVWTSTDDGGTWTRLGMSDTSVLSLAVNSAAGLIFAGTISGIYKSSIPRALSLPSPVSPANEATGISTNTRLSWHSSPGATSYRLQLSADSAFQSVVYDTTTVDTAKSIAGLSNTTTYYWRVNASNADRTSLWSIVWSFRTAIAPSSLVNPPNGATEVSSSPMLTWNVSTGAASYELQVSVDSSFATTVFDKSGVRSTSQVVAGLSQGTTYYWRVSASDSNGSSGWSPVWSFTTFTYPSNIQVSTQFTPPGTSDQTNYRIIGLPGALDIPVSSLLSGNEGTDWDAYYDNGDAQGYQVKYNGSSAFDFQPGRALWIFSRKPFSVSQNASTVPLDTGDCYSIALHGGWNLISDPFEKSVSWSDIQSLNGVTQPTYSYDGNYNTSTSLDPYSGYYFYNDQNLTSLRIPYVYSTISQSKPGKPYGKVSSIQDNVVTLSLSSSRNKSLLVSVGFDPTVSDTLNKRDIFAPPDNFDNMRIHVVDQDVAGYWKKLYFDFKTEIGQGQSFDVEVKNLTGKTAAIKPMLTSGFDNYGVYLVDNGTHTFYDLKTVDSISVGGAYKYKSYALLIGDGNYIDSIRAIYAPKNYYLYQNYPNPFNPVTIIRYEIPKKAGVTLEVYNVLGELVRTLVDQIQQPGYYKVDFNGTGLASGVYFCRLAVTGIGALNGGNYHQVKKMVLLK